MKFNVDYKVGDYFTGVLLETFKEAGISRPRVRPVEMFAEDVRVEFPRSIREDNPLGTKFRALVKSIITEARVVAKEKIQAEEVEVAKKFDPDLNVKTVVTTVDIAEWNKLPSYKKNAVTSRYRRLFPAKETEEFYEGKNIRVDADRIIKGVDGNAVSVMQWALENAKDVPDI